MIPRKRTTASTTTTATSPTATGRTMTVSPERPVELGVAHLQVVAERRYEAPAAAAVRA